MVTSTTRRDAHINIEDVRTLVIMQGRARSRTFSRVTTARNPRRSTRRPPTAYVRIVTEDVNNACIEIQPDLKLTDIHTPETYEQATHKSNAHARYWWESMDKEMKDLQKHVTWGLVAREDVPKRHRVTKSRWVYAIKVKRDGTIDRFKSRFVVCGYSQIQGVDYTQSFSATLRATSMRTLLALAAGESLSLEHFDVTSAFTQSDIDCDIYVELLPPSGVPTVFHPVTR